MTKFSLLAALFLQLLLSPVSSNFLYAQDSQPYAYSSSTNFPGSQIADYRLGGLINVPTFVTQPYFLQASAGCPIIDRPVCGVDGKTYQNECFLGLAKILKAYDGWCLGNNKGGSKPPQELDPFIEIEATGFPKAGAYFANGCPCNDNFYPVCSVRGITYGNLCRAKCFGDKPAQIGPCYSFYFKPTDNVICKCPVSQEKVCGKDGVTYENSCVMNCAGAEFAGLNACPSPCGCIFAWKPVCGADGQNYINECELNCAKARLAFEGLCDNNPLQKCAYCIGTISPVCGVDGKTYDNLCFLKCKGVELAADRACLPPGPNGTCICPKLYLPVCTKDGITFPNECEAKCSNQIIVFNGPCQKEKEAEKPPKHYGKSPTNDCLSICAVFGNMPVCGSDGRTYGNACALSCFAASGVKMSCNYPCQPVVNPNCGCSSEIKPVCGADGRSYLNACTLQSFKIDKACDGPCSFIGNYSNNQTWPRNENEMKNGTNDKRRERKDEDWTFKPNNNQNNQTKSNSSKNKKQKTKNGKNESENSQIVILNWKIAKNQNSGELSSHKANYNKNEWKEASVRQGATLKTLVGTTLGA